MKVQAYVAAVAGALVLSSFGMHLLELAPTEVSFAHSDSCELPGRIRWGQILRIAGMCLPGQRLVWDRSYLRDSGGNVLWWVADGSDPSTGKECIRVILDATTGDLIRLNCQLPTSEAEVAAAYRTSFGNASVCLPEKARSWLERLDHTMGVRACWHYEITRNSTPPYQLKTAVETPQRWWTRDADGRTRRSRIRLDPSSGNLVQVMFRYEPSNFGAKVLP